MRLTGAKRTAPRRSECANAGLRVPARPRQVCGCGGREGVLVSPRHPLRPSRTLAGGAMRLATVSRMRHRAMAASNVTSAAHSFAPRVAPQSRARVARDRRAADGCAQPQWRDRASGSCVARASVRAGHSGWRGEHCDDPGQPQTHTLRSKRRDPQAGVGALRAPCDTRATHPGGAPRPSCMYASEALTQPPRGPAPSSRAPPRAVRRTRCARRSRDRCATRAVPAALRPAAR